MKILFVTLFTIVALGCNAQGLEIPTLLKKVSDKPIKHKAYTLSFNETMNTPNWVAWELTSAEASATKASRSKDFFPDPLVSAKHRADGYAYKGSGYDRGHMCPAGDNKWDYQAMNESFYMSNMCPQDRTLNGTWWEHLESACRRWAGQEGSVYIVCGPIYTNKNPQRIGFDVKVAVPDAFFKVVLSTKKGQEKAIGFYYKNDGTRQTMDDAARTVDEIEKITGIDFFTKLDDKLEKKVEAMCNLRSWR